MTRKEIARGIGARLKEARKAADFRSAREAALSLGWNYPTYGSHERGRTVVNRVDIEIYAKAFRARGSKFTAEYILFGDTHKTSINDLNNRHYQHENPTVSPEVSAVREFRRHARTLMQLWSNADDIRRALAVSAARAVLEHAEGDLGQPNSRSKKEAKRVVVTKIVT